MSTQPHPTARGLLVWLQSHPERLRELLDLEGEGADDLAPAGDPAIRAHLRLVAEALAANAAPAATGALEGLARRLPRTLREADERLDAAIRDVGEATAFELGLQFGGGTGEDPGILSMIDRRIRIAAWTRVFLEELDAARGGEPVEPRVLAWMVERQTQLADTIFAMDRRAKLAELERGGPDAIADPAVVNRIGQAAMLQAHTRFLVEGLAAHL